MKRKLSLQPPVAGEGKVKKKEPEAFTATQEAPAEGQANVGKNRKILVADDNAVVLKAFQLKLEAAGFVVIPVADGGAVATTAAEERPDLIVLDVNFPPSGGGMEWNGLSIMQWLDRFLEGLGIPIIIVTGEDPARCKWDPLESTCRHASLSIL